MVTNLAIDPELLNEALSVDGFLTKEEIINQALKEFIQRRKQHQIIDLFGNLPADANYDYTKGRK